jgi:hypothetical protein
MGTFPINSPKWAWAYAKYPFPKVNIRVGMVNVWTVPHIQLFGTA